MSQGQRIILSVLAAVVFAFIVRGIFAIHGLDRLLNVMTISFIVCLPFGVGYLTIYLSKIETIEYSANAFFIPFIPIFVFFFTTLLFKVEGFACWLMIMPIFFSLLMLNLPSGLTLYIFVSTIFGVTQQILIMKDKKSDTPPRNAVVAR